MRKFINKHEEGLPFLGPSCETGRKQFVHEKRTEKVLIVLGNHILSGEIDEENLLFGKDVGEIQSFRVLAQHGPDCLVLDERFNPVERRLNPFFAAVELHCFEPLPFRSNTRIRDARRDRGSLQAGCRAHQMLSLNECNVRGDKSVGDVEQPSGKPRCFLE